MSEIASQNAMPSLDDDLAQDLRAVVESVALLQLLRFRAGLTQDVIATATGSSLRSVRNWERGVRLRQDSDDRLRYLAEVVAVLSGTLTPRGVGQWLRARHRVLGGRPVELIAADADESVLDAAEELAGDGLD